MVVNFAELAGARVIRRCDRYAANEYPINITMTKIHKGYLPGSIRRVVEMHAKYYAHNWGFDLYFETKVATELSKFMTRFDPNKDAFWIVINDDQIEGSITIDGVHAEREGAHLRWFIISDDLRGQGYGNDLLLEAIGFCQEHNYNRVYLNTFDGLHAARKLYEKAGFMLVHEERGKQWGTEVTEQKFVLDL
jgi:RimJ/RimL family protein N-acetyltransferase